MISEYSLNNVYNADETGIHYQALPDNIYLFRNENVKGCKTSKEYMTVLCSVRMTDEKEQLLIL